MSENGLEGSRDKETSEAAAITQVRESGLEQEIQEILSRMLDRI